MEVFVGRDSEFTIGLAAFHRVQRSHDAVQILGLGALCGKRGGGRFNDGSGLHEGKE